jgi:hypothetical protein
MMRAKKKFADHSPSHLCQGRSKMYRKLLHSSAGSNITGQPTGNQTIKMLPQHVLIVLCIFVPVVS